MTQKKVFEQEHMWGQLILIGLGILSLGLAIAYIGFFLTNH